MSHSSGFGRSKIRFPSLEFKRLGEYDFRTMVWFSNNKHTYYYFLESGSSWNFGKRVPSEVKKYNRPPKTGELQKKVLFILIKAHYLSIPCLSLFQNQESPLAADQPWIIILKK